MNVLGVDVCTCLLILAVLLAVGAVAVIFLLKVYAVCTCGHFKSETKMEGKVVLITGANSGIGRETARDLAKRGARIIMACRNIDTGNEAKEDIVKTSGNTNIVVKKLDLSSQKSIREFAADVLKTEPKLNVLIHNAGTAETKTKLSDDGIELTMATNHFGPFLLTHLLIELLKRSGPSRIVVVASELYRFASLNLNRLNPTTTYFAAYYYYVSKYANICFTNELARRLEGTNVTANCLHPGMVDSGIWRNIPFPFNYPTKLLTKGMFKTTTEGCQTTLYVAVSEELEGVNGKYFMDCKERGLSSGAKDMNKAKKLWELSEKLVNLKEDDPKI